MLIATDEDQFTASRALRSSFCSRDGGCVSNIVHDVFQSPSNPGLDNLFQKITVDSYNGQARVNLLPSPWGVAQWGTGVPGQVIMNTAGWDEASAAMSARW
jgi:hypothetical protein